MDAESRRRMSRHIKLVLLGSLPTMLGCGGCGGETSEPKPDPMEEVEEIDEDIPPEEPAHFIGAPFFVWWTATHPPIVTRRLIPRAAVATGGYTRSSTGTYHRSYYGGRSSYLWGGSPSGPAHSSGIARGGFGSTGHSGSAGA